MIRLNFENIPVPNGFLNLFIECAPPVFSEFEDIIISDFEIVEIGTFSYGSDSEEDYLSFPSEFTLILQVKEGSYISNSILQFLSIYDVSIKVYRAGFDTIFIDEIELPIFAGVLDYTSLKPNLIDQTLELKFNGSEQIQRDLPVNNNPYSYPIPNHPVVDSDNGYYPVSFIFRDVIARHLYTQFYSFSSDSSIKAKFKFKDTSGGISSQSYSYATLLGAPCVHPDYGITIAFLAVWNKFFFGRLSSGSPFLPTTAAESLSLIARNFGCRIIFLSNNEIFLQQRWRNETKISVTISDGDIVEKEASVILPKKGARAELYQIQHEGTGFIPPFDNEIMTPMLVQDYGLVDLDSSGNIKNAEVVETLPFVHPGSQYIETSGTYHKGIMVSVPRPGHEENVNYNNFNTPKPASFSVENDEEKVLSTLVSEKIFKEISAVRITFRVVVHGTDWSFKDYYTVETSSPIFRDEVMIYRVQHMAKNYIKNQTELLLISFAIPRLNIVIS